MAQGAGAMVYVDAVQYASHRLIDVKDLGCDFLACSPYRVLWATSGRGVWQTRRLESLRAYKLRCASNDLPFRFSWAPRPLS
ncbi:MAG: hypothetical protein CM15mP103_06580 [Gammaproteobacteria bacterium]|nr:MAG: hypothetical protein CM15mP103_06580 [Gammaproteobacteria bacterium]